MNLEPRPHLKWALVGFSKVSIYPNHVSNPKLKKINFGSLIPKYSKNLNQWLLIRLNYPPREPPVLSSKLKAL
jgi:hypothetical protein